MTDIRPIRVLPRETVLDVRQLADVLGVSVDTVEKQDFPMAGVGRKRVFVWGLVVDHLEKKSA